VQVAEVVKSGEMEIIRLIRRPRMAPDATTASRLLVVRGTSLCLFDALVISDFSKWNFDDIATDQWRETDFAHSRLWGTLNVSIVRNEPVRLGPGKERKGRVMSVLKMLHKNPTYAGSDLAKRIRENCDPTLKDRIYGPDSNPIVVHDRAHRQVCIGCLFV